MIESIIDTKTRNTNRQKPDGIEQMGEHDGIGRTCFSMFPQRDGYHCGPDSALTAMSGMGREGQVAGRIYNEKEFYERKGD